MTQPPTPYYSAKEAAELLGISRATLYAYVSRGLVRSEETPGKSRAKRYLAEDVQVLLARKEQRRDPAQVVQQALNWGTPVLSSAITLIDNGRFYYRGQDALEVAGSHTLEETAALIWLDDCTAAAGLFGREPAGPLWTGRLPQPLAAAAALSPVEQFQILLPLAAAGDIAAYHLRPLAMAQSGGRILQLLVAITAGRFPGQDGLVAALQQAWAPADSQAHRLLSQALILCADHELNASSFTARVVASVHSTPYNVVLAGLAALRGLRHGGYAERMEALFREVARPERAQAVLAGRLKRGEEIPGFGHRLYPAGDPRGRMLLAGTAAAYGDKAAVKLAQAIAAAAADLIDGRPNLDFGLTTLSGALDLPPGSGLTLFALGRTIGWIGQAIEQLESGEMIRPRARYVGR